jgi:hypothetical protein
VKPIFILFFELLNIDAHEDYLQGKPNFTSFLFLVEEICLETCDFSQRGQLRIFLIFRFLLLKVFSCVPNQDSKHIMS